MRSHGPWIQRWRVRIGFFFAAALILLAKPQPETLAVGGVLASIGLSIRAWASGHIRKGARLATSGPYAYTRNPLYAGSFITGVGITVAASQWYLTVIFAALFLGIYVPLMRREASKMAETFGDDYRTYADAVPMLLARLTPYRNGKTTAASFDVNLYKRHREYRAAIGFVLAFCVLLAKAFVLQ